MDLPKRKPTRWTEYDYSQNGAYFLTLCTHGRRCILCDIVGGGILDAPQCTVELSQTGNAVKDTIQYINEHNEYMVIDKYVIMPNHIHLIVQISGGDGTSGMPSTNGTCGSPSPTNAVIPKLISSLKRFTNKYCGVEIWQRSYYDHIIRNEEDYLQIWRYIDENPLKWREDELHP